MNAYECADESISAVSLRKKKLYVTEEFVVVRIESWKAILVGFLEGAEVGNGN